MAYDLLLRRHVPSSFSREGGAPAVVAGGVAVLAALGCLVIPRIRRQSEIQQYKRNFNDGLDSTREYPAISMSELVRQPWER